ncbi:MAG: gliding motility-associated C-terminal domain-containing protein, partial [Saprospiraceae bacterium]
TAANGCTNTTTAVVLADLDVPAIVTATPAQLNCTVKQVTLNSSVQTPGNYLYQWSTLNGTIVSGANTQTPLVSAAGLYSLTVTNTRNGCTATREVPVTVDPSTPTGAVLQVRDVSCFGDKNGAVLIESVIGGEAPYEYALENGNLGSNVLYTSLAPRSYNLLIVDANGCEFETTFVVGEPEELLINLGPDTTIKLGQPIELSLQNTVNFPNRVVNLIAKPTDLVFRFDCDTCAPFLPTNSFQYRVTVTDANGCTAADTRLVIVDKTRNVYIPNIFNPESASENGLLMIYGGIDVAEIKSFQIYDRWGALVHEYYSFQPNYIPSAWDGKVRGDDASPGVFVYVAEILFKDGELIIYKGDVTLIRQ